MPEDTTARSAYVHMALRTAAVYTAERRVRRVGGPPAYVDIPGVYEVDPDFQDTQQTTGELALLGIVASLAEKDVKIEKLKRKIQLLEDVVEGREMEEVENLCGVEADESSDTEEVWEEETIERSDESKDEAQRAEESVRDTSSGAESADDETQSTVGSNSTKRGYRTRALRTGLPDERGIRSRVGPWSAAEEVSDPEPSLWAGKKVIRAAERMSARLKRGEDKHKNSNGVLMYSAEGRSTSRETDNGEGSSSHAGPSNSMSHQDDAGQRH